MTTTNSNNRTLLLLLAASVPLVVVGGCGPEGPPDPHFIHESELITGLDEDYNTGLDRNFLYVIRVDPETDGEVIPEIPDRGHDGGWIHLERSLSDTTSAFIWAGCYAETGECLVFSGEVFYPWVDNGAYTRVYTVPQVDGFHDRRRGECTVGLWYPLFPEYGFDYYAAVLWDSEHEGSTDYGCLSAPPSSSP